MHGGGKGFCSGLLGCGGVSARMLQFAGRYIIEALSPCPSCLKRDHAN